MIRIVFVTLACAVGLMAATIIDRATAPSRTDGIIKIAKINKMVTMPTSAAQFKEPVRVVYAGYGLNAQTTSSVSASQAELATVAVKPSLAETAKPTSLISSAAPVSIKSSTKTLVDLNTGSLEELNATGGGMIGKAILRGRPYQTLDDLVAKRVISRTTLQSIKARVAVNS